MELRPAGVYVDGGVRLKNPSPHGGMWAWVSVDTAGGKLREDSGCVRPIDIGVESVTNNVTELLAALMALRELPPGWAVTLHSDSMVTLHRLGDSDSFSGVPPWMVKECLRARKGKKWLTQLVIGHPTLKELAQGFRRVRGVSVPVSAYNVRCDELCRLAGEKL